MKRKFVKRKECEKYITSEEEVVFTDSSPLEEISSPRGRLFHAIHGNYKTGGIQGTIVYFS